LQLRHVRVTFRAAEELVNQTLIVERSFNGPRLSGNGGYVGGLLARHFDPDSAVEVTFRAPIPLERSLALHWSDNSLQLHDGDTLICEAHPGSVDQLDPPPPPANWNDVMGRERDGGSFEDSDFHYCIVCGRGRAVGDGLRVLGTSGPDAGRSLSCYVPHAAHADGDGRIKREFVWGTLDCPGAWAVQDPGDWRPALTGRMTAMIIDPPRIGERCAVVGWKLGAEGRKLHSGTALYTESGRLCALGHCTWILLKD
jgi:hypothetical protein